MAGKALTTNAGQEKRGRGGNNNPTGEGKFTGADDPRRNNNGQRNAAAVRFSRDLRELIVAAGEAERSLHDKAGRLVGVKKQVEWMVDAVWNAALKGQPWAVAFIAERVEGKTPQTLDVNALLGLIDLSKLDEPQLERIANGENPLAVVLDGLGK